MEEKEINKIFSKNLNYWLERRGKTQADLYKKMEVSSATASDWCNEKKIPRTDKLVSIAKWLMIELSDLLEEKPYVESDLNDILFRLKDDIQFREIVTAIYNFNSEQLTDIVKYIKLLSLSRD